MESDIRDVRASPDRSRDLGGDTMKQRRELGDRLRARLSSELMTPEKVRLLVGQRVRQLRLEQGLTAAELGRIVDKQRTYVSDFENGRLNFTQETLSFFAEALGVDEVDLYTFPERNTRHAVLDMTREASEDGLLDAQAVLIRSREANRKKTDERNRRLLTRSKP